VRGLAVQERGAGGRPLEAEEHADECRLSTAVRPGDGDELPLPDPEIDVLEHELAGSKAERHRPELGDRGGYRHPSASRSTARFDRMTER
jgi:hypothetical protein